MCSINGVIKIGSNNSFSNEVELKLINLIINAEKRGKDSFGIKIFRETGMPIEFKFIDRPSNVLGYDGEKVLGIPENFSVVLNNNRAEPTTEYVKNKSLNDVQPFSHKNITIVHNGTIANDKELIEEFGLKLNTTIDSAVIPHVLQGITPQNAPEKFGKLIGSFAIAAYDSENDKVYLATNYKPLYMLIHKPTNMVYFTSFPEYMQNFPNSYKLKYELKWKRDFIVHEVPAYSGICIDRSQFNSKNFVEFSLREPEYTNVQKKALICASSGMDSTVAAKWAQDQGYDVTLLHFQYHCRAEEKENEAIDKIAKRLDVPLVKVTTDFFRDVIKGSRLVTGTEEIVKEGDKGAELAYEWVPARNLIFLSIAAGYAEAHDIDYIILGGNLEESGAYPDNELIFQKKFNAILPYALNLGKKVEILTPIADMMKHEIVKLGLEIGAPLDLTWSCYEPGEKHCGECGPCFMRKTAFQMNNAKEVIEYLK